MRKPEKIREEARVILKKYKISSPPVPVEFIAESLGATVRYSSFEGELAGMLVRRDGQAVIGVNSFHHTNRQRFTIAHEIGHLRLHKGDVHIDRSFRVNNRNAVSSQAIDPEEIEANRFAAELLMPFDLIMRELRDNSIDVEDENQIKLLADKYEVSVQAMTLRLAKLLNI